MFDPLKKKMNKYYEIEFIIINFFFLKKFFFYINIYLNEIII